MPGTMLALSRLLKTSSLEAEPQQSRGFRSGVYWGAGVLEGDGSVGAGWGRRRRLSSAAAPAADGLQPDGKCKNQD